VLDVWCALRTLDGGQCPPYITAPKKGVKYIIPKNKMGTRLSTHSIIHFLKSAFLAPPPRLELGTQGLGIPCSIHC
jgi:hypothetical protein